MTTQEIYSATTHEQSYTENPAAEVEAIVLPEAPPIPSIEFVRQALTLSVKEGNLTNVEAAKQLNTWDPGHPVHPGHFR